jgi:hypothetical protein
MDGSETTFPMDITDLRLVLGTAGPEGTFGSFRDVSVRSRDKCGTNEPPVRGFGRGCRIGI